MKTDKISVIVDPDLCIGCGLCIRVCPSRTLQMKEEKAVVTDTPSMLCGHCAAVCPAGAVTLPALSNNASSFETFSSSEKWCRPGEGDTGELVRLMRSRRSCRNYTDEPVPAEFLRDLVRIGITAPSGTNSQRWMFTVLPDREKVTALGEYIGGFFKKLNKTAESRLLRHGLRLLGKPELHHYYKRYYPSVQKALRQWHEEKKDLLFHGAPAVIIVSSRPGASCPCEDALLASQNILLGAHSLGLGTCLIGYAVEAMKKDGFIQTRFDIPGEETVYSVIALGHPDEEYKEVTGRKELPLRMVF